VSSVGASCRRDYKAYRTSGYRPQGAVKWIVLHDTEGGTAKSIARYFASSTAGGSTHLVVDDEECYRCLSNDQVPWGAKGANYAGFHIEQCGYARWTDGTWRTHMKMLRRAAYKTALHCKRFKIPVRFVDAQGLLAGRKGITTHVECSKAFGGSHWDPGPGWPKALFMGLVRAYYTQLTIKRV
jgi:NAD-dependent dihydropyrimidine dehydrogenase PreA subunit